MRSGTTQAKLTKAAKPPTVSRVIRVYQPPRFVRTLPARDARAAPFSWMNSKVLGAKRPAKSPRQALFPHNPVRAASMMLADRR
jgi:hypothetical protein